jgi:hypothetical protein
MKMIGLFAVCIAVAALVHVTSSAKIDAMEPKFDNGIKHLTSKINVEASDLRRRIEKLEHTAKGEKKYLYRG